ncbi:MAG: DegT/DnrJ/EryC1/StrS family aminotransferase [Nitrospinae bacterium]|nr:DegT/DnrJ/EryC1/StrS family aminotransferase [Nitrospinota bacterium]
MKVDFFRHNITTQDRKALDRTLRGLFISTGSEVRLFEEKFAEYLHLPHCVGVTSATAALHLALEALGVGKGDEVITTPMSFIATANAIMHAGAKPVFVDVEADTGNMAAANIEKAITKKTRAILPVHLYGQMCDMKAISRIARARKLVVVEDAAHAVEARRDGAAPGQLGDAAAFSFYATKNITSGEGGAVTVKTQKLRDILRKTRTHGMSRDAAERYGRKFAHYDMDIYGWKYNMSNIQAALLLNQMDRIEANLEKRQRVWALYLKELAGWDGLGFPAIRDGARSAMHLFTVWVPPQNRDTVLRRMEDNGIGVSAHFLPIHLMRFYRETFGFKQGMFPNAEAIGAKVVTLPFYPGLKPAQVRYVAATLKNILATL